MNYQPPTLLKFSYCPFKSCNASSLRFLEVKSAVVGIVTRRHNGVTNWPLPILFKTITSYKSSGFTLLKALSVVKKKI
jgi:hypothetical protein